MTKLTLGAATAVLMVFGTGVSCNNTGGAGSRGDRGNEQPAISEEPGFSPTPSPTGAQPSTTP